MGAGTSSLSPGWLLFWAACVLAGIILLIARCRLHAFMALTIGALAMGLVARVEWAMVVRAFGEGVGAMLSNIAVVVALGTILGKLLAASRGATVLAETFVTWWGEARLAWVMLVLALIVGVPTWFTVGLVLLLPIYDALTRQSNHPGLMFPLLAGLAAGHGFVP